MIRYVSCTGCAIGLGTDIQRDISSLKGVFDLRGFVGTSLWRFEFTWACLSLLWVALCICILYALMMIHEKVLRRLCSDDEYYYTTYE